jgi:hypothetical protein
MHFRNTRSRKPNNSSRIENLKDITSESFDVMLMAAISLYPGLLSSVIKKSGAEKNLNSVGTSYFVGYQTETLTSMFKHEVFNEDVDLYPWLSESDELAPKEEAI